MKLAIDAYYYEDSDAYTVGVFFEDWNSKAPLKVVSCHTSEFSGYIPGEFYKRELPGILNLLETIDMSEIDTIIVDGFVGLPDGKKGLGQHLWEELKSQYPNLKIIGVSKSKFFRCEGCSIAIFRGAAVSPLWINTNENISETEAAEKILNMHGKYKLPTILKILDKETKKFKNGSKK